MALILQQTKADPRLHTALRKYAFDEGTFFKDIYTKAITDFIDEINASESSDTRPMFFSSPKAGKTINMRLTPTLKDTALAVAIREQTSARRLYYTALVRFAFKKGLFTQEDLRWLSA